jgi:hypothetical protein
MKYPRGTVLKWSDKAFSKAGSDDGAPLKNERFIVLDKSLHIFVSEGKIVETDHYHRHDSFLESVKEPYPTKGMTHKVHAADSASDIPKREIDLAKEFGYKILRG